MMAHNNQNGAKRVLVADFHPLALGGIVRIVAQEGLIVCGSASHLQGAIDLVEESRPDVVVCEMTLPGGPGLELVKYLREKRPELPVVVFTSHSEAFDAERSLHAGARAFVTKDSPPQELVEGIRQALAHSVYVSRNIAPQMLTQISTVHGARVGYTEDLLTGRELELLSLLGNGRSAGEIASQWGRSVRTVESHCNNIKRKLHLGSFRDLMTRAVQWAHDSGPEAPRQWSTPPRAHSHRPGGNPNRG